jgi:hypothetical protein
VSGVLSVEVGPNTSYFEPVRNTVMEIAGRRLPARWKCDLVQGADVWAAQWVCVPMENGHNVVVVGPDIQGMTQSRWSAHLYARDIEAHEWNQNDARKERVNPTGSVWFQDDAALLKAILEWSTLPGGMANG